MLVIVIVETAPTGLSKGAILAYAGAGNVNVQTNTSGQLSESNLIGFGATSGDITVIEDAFTLGSNNEYYVFPMPYKGKITAVAGRYSNVASWRPTTSISLYLAVAVAPAGSNNYTIIPESRALAEPFEQGVLHENRTVKTALVEDLSIIVNKGDTIAVMPGFAVNGGTLRQTLPFTFTGSLTIEKIEEDE